MEAGQFQTGPQKLYNDVKTEGQRCEAKVSLNVAFNPRCFPLSIASSTTRGAISRTQAPGLRLSRAMLDREKATY
jgi:hypothetical protein